MTDATRHALGLVAIAAFALSVIGWWAHGTKTKGVGWFMSNGGLMLLIFGGTALLGWLVK